MSTATRSVVASFPHATSRALDPFPHRHNVVANAVVDEFGEQVAAAKRNVVGRGAPAHENRQRRGSPSSAFIDTNVLVRHLTGDPPELAARATAYLRTAPELLLTALIAAETVYVLESAVGVTGLEPVTSCVSSKRSNQLSYTPLAERAP